MLLTMLSLSLLATVFLYVPGLIAIGPRKLGLIPSIAFSPFITLALYALVTIIYSFLGISANWISVFFPSIVLCMAILCLTFRSKMPSTAQTKGIDHTSLLNALRRNELVYIALYLIVALIVLWFVFIRFIPSLDYIIQGYDTVFHVGVVQTFVSTGDWSPLSVSLYPDDCNYNPEQNDGSFYPSLWHCICSMLVSATGTSVAAAANATNIALCAVVFPLGSLALMTHLFPGEKVTIAAGSIATSVFSSFPYFTIIQGEQFPQLMAFSLVPSACAFVRFALSPNGKTGALSIAIESVCIFLTLCLSQTNAIFVVGIFFGFCLISWVFTVSSVFEEKQRFRFRLQFSLITIAAASVLWVGLYFAPFMSGVVSFSWESFASPAQATLNAALLSLNNSSSPQPLLALFVLIGGIHLLVKRCNIWLVSLYLFAICIYIVDTSSDGFLKHFLAGFWYTDPNRISAMVAIFGIPLATKGIASLISLIAGKRKVAKRHARSRLALAFGAGILALLIMVFPSFSLGDSIRVSTAFGDKIDNMRYLTSSTFPSILDNDEQSFMDLAKNEIPDGELIINIPSDGSCFLYGLDGMNLYFRREQGTSDQARIIRLHLDEYATNPLVQDAVRACGARYVLVLDPSTSFHTYRYEDWAGISSITNDTPGFETVLQRGDMALYKIIT